MGLLPAIFATTAGMAAATTLAAIMGVITEGAATGAACTAGWTGLTMSDCRRIRFLSRFSNLVLRWRPARLLSPLINDMSSSFVGFFPEFVFPELVVPEFVEGILFGTAGGPSRLQQSGALLDLPGVRGKRHEGHSQESHGFPTSDLQAIELLRFRTRQDSLNRPEHSLLIVTEGVGLDLARQVEESPSRVFDLAIQLATILSRDSSPALCELPAPQMHRSREKSVGANQDGSLRNSVSHECVLVSTFTTRCSM